MFAQIRPFFGSLIKLFQTMFIFIFLGNEARDKVTTVQVLIISYLVFFSLQITIISGVHNYLGVSKTFVGYYMDVGFLPSLM